MTRTVLSEMILDTAIAPRKAAARLISIGLSRNVLWQALILMIVLNAIVYWIGTTAAPSGQPLPPMLATPFMFALTLGCGAVVTVFAVTFVGKWLGGEARLDDVLVLITWLQLLRLLVQLAAMVLSVLVPGLALLALMAINIYGLWVFANFIDVAHRFNSPLKAFGVILMAGMGIAIGLAVMLSLIGATAIGVSAHV